MIGFVQFGYIFNSFSYMILFQLTNGANSMLLLKIIMNNLKIKKYFLVYHRLLLATIVTDSREAAFTLMLSRKSKDKNKRKELYDTVRIYGCIIHISQLYFWGVFAFGFFFLYNKFI